MVTYIVSAFKSSLSFSHSPLHTFSPPLSLFHVLTPNFDRPLSRARIISDISPGTTTEMQPKIGLV